MAHTVIVPESRQTNLLLALVTKRLAEQLQRIANALTTYVIATAVKLHTGSMHHSLAVDFQGHPETNGSGLPGTAPPGPAIPVIDTESCAPECSKAP